jgi:hypothetical protein
MSSTISKAACKAEARTRTALYQAKKTYNKIILEILI